MKGAEQRLWYARQAVEQGSSRTVLVHQIDCRLFDRQGKAQTNFFARTLPAPQSDLAQALIKDPYAFDFLALGPEMSERQLERGLLEQLRALILELGKGCAFVGSQHPLEVGGQDYYLHLLFYHLRLRCYVVIELKIEELKPEFAGKMNFYLSAVDSQPSPRERRRQHRHHPLSGQERGGRRVRLMRLRQTDARGGISGVSNPARDLARRTIFRCGPGARVPFMALVNLRIGIELPLALGRALSELAEQGRAPVGSDDFQAAVRTMNQAAHGIDVPQDRADEPAAAAARFLATLRTQVDDGE